eukprot:TRINITY_DN110426_c0_g1_i1.p1 TRINITY_DN110426_c0_g1~~TRINITY_DN110426_c0_g1_i1.p1  ORF type:complete len:713 (+),score=213.69 TRINITY_DN110426_c0_g1_i1:102-2240(+)
MKLFIFFSLLVSAFALEHAGHGHRHYVRHYVRHYKDDVQESVKTELAASTQHARYTYKLDGSTRLLLQVVGTILTVGLICGLFWYFESTVPKLLSCLTQTPGSEKEEEPERQPILNQSATFVPAPSKQAAEDVSDFESSDLADYDKMVKKMMAKAEKQFGPKFQQGAEVQTILQDKMSSFGDKAKALVLNELNDTCGSVAKVLEAEEFTSMLEWDATVASNFPSLSVLMAGLLVPVNLSLSYISHVIQILCVTLPVAFVTGMALYFDRHRACGSIPGLKPWAAITAALAIAITCARISMLARISAADRDLKAKSAEMQARLTAAEAGGSTGWANLKELFICHSTTLQYAVVCEARTRMSGASHIVGAGTFAWLVMTWWNLYIYFGYLFVPGVVAFHLDAFGQPTYCGAWVTACSAKIACLIAVVFFFLNLFTIFFWATDTVLSMDGVASKIASAAKSFDRANMGIPVAQFLVKVFFVRGSTDVLCARFAVAMREKSELAKEYGSIESRLMALKAKVEAKEKAMSQVEEQMSASGGGTLEAQAELLQTSGLDVEVMKKKGLEMVEAARANTIKVEEAHTEEIDKLVKQVEQLMETVTDSEEFKAAKAKAEAGMEQAKIAAAEAQEQAMAAAAQAQEQAKVLAAQAQEQGKVLAAQAQEHGAKLAAQAQEQGAKFAEEAAAQAQEHGSKLAAQAQETAAKAQGQAQKGKKQSKK